MRKVLLIFLFFANILLLNSELFANGSIKGKVLDIEGGVLSGVNIQVEGTRIGTVSGSDGTFILRNIPSGEQTIIISHVLYETEKVTVNIEDDYSTEIVFKFKERRSFSLSEVVVTATKYDAEPEKVPQSVTLISREEIEKGYFYNVGEMLDYVPGVRIIRSGTAGADNGVSIRSLNGGPASDKSLVLVDGKPVNDGWEGGVNWNTIPTDMVEKIEVVKGPGSALYGSQATGGVINVFSKLPVPGFHGWISAGYEMNGSENIIQTILFHLGIEIHTNHFRHQKKINGTTLT